LVSRLPAGCIEKNENSETACRRELLEETGYRAEKVMEISNFTQDTSRFTGCSCHLFMAMDVEKVKDAEEGIEVVEISLPDAIEMIRKRKIKDLPTIAGILLSQLFIFIR
jgi:ADP-ribose pyrophosphatase